MKKSIGFFYLLLFVHFVNAQKTFPIWPGAATGSESWNWKEQIDSVSIPGDPLAYNVVQPSLIYYPADASIANGTSVIIFPGGSFCYLHVKTEGEDVARWLNKKGVSAFVLKYRLVHSETTHPMQERMDKASDTVTARKAVLSLAPLAIADAKQSIVWVRKHAVEFKLSPGRIGIIGFSAGGALTAAVLNDYTKENRPDFAAPIYAYIPPYLLKTVPADAPPLFIAAASDDELHLTPMSVELYSKWLASNHSAELHIYSKGGHGFGMNKHNQPSDTWIDRLGDWMELQGFIKK
ncbi:MAG: alpha/beta hydrolase [Chitinophagaceae bacterium]